MKALTVETARALLDAAQRQELDAITGILVRLSSDALAECKALVWLGQGREAPKYWDALVAEARARLDDKTVLQLAEDPQLAACLRAGLERLDDAGKL